MNLGKAQLVQRKKKCRKIKTEAQNVKSINVKEARIVEEIETVREQQLDIIEKKKKGQRRKKLEEIKF